MPAGVVLETRHLTTMDNNASEKHQKLTPMYLQEILEDLKLDDWDVKIDHDTRPAGTTPLLLTVSTTDRRAVLSFGPNFTTLTPAKQRHHLIFQLLSCHIAPLKAVAERHIQVTETMEHVENIERALRTEVTRIIEPAIDIPTWD